MAQEDKIDSYIDRNGVQQDTEFMLGELNKLLKGVQEAKGAISTFGTASGFKQVQQASVQAASAINTMTEATKNMEQAGKQAGLTWTQFVGQRMGAAMKEAMAQGLSHAEAHTAAIRKISAEWKEYKASGESAVKATTTVTKDAIGYVNQLKANINALQKSFNSLNEAESKGLKGQNIQKRIAEEKVLLAKATQTEAQAQEQSNRQKEMAAKYESALTKEIEKAEKARDREIAQQAKLNNEYEQLKAKYTIAANTAKQLAAAKGLDNEETKEAVAMAQQYYQQLMNIEKAVGQNQRNVGNYTQATFALNQVLREAPAFANSFQTGIMAISNNIPILRDEFVKLREATGSNAQAFSVLLKSMFSWQTVLLLGITLLTVYAKEIKEWGAALFSANKNMEKTEVTLKRFADAAEAAKKEVADLRSQIEYLNSLGQINLDINTSQVPKLNALGQQLGELGAQAIAAGEEIVLIDEKIASMQANASKSLNFMLSNLSSKDMELYGKLGGDIDLAATQFSEAGKKLYDAYKNSTEGLADLQNQRTIAGQKQTILFRQQALARAEIEKEEGEQRRKLILESVRTETELTQQRNQLILSNERSTLAQRVTALKSTLEAQRRAIEAERDNVLNDPTSSTVDRTLAVKRAGAEIKAAELDTQAQILEVREDFRLRDLEAQKRSFERVKQFTIDLNEELSENTAFSLEERLRLQQQYVEDQRQVLEADYRLKLQQAGISDEEIAALAANRDYKVKNKKITDKELKDLQVQHDTDLLQLSVDTNEKTTEILKSELQRQKNVREGHLEELKRLYESTSLTTSTDFAREMIALNNQFQQRKISLEKYNAERAKLEKTYQEREKSDLIKNLQDQLVILSDAEYKELAAKGRVAKAKMAFDDAVSANASAAVKKKLSDELNAAKEELKIATLTAAQKIALEGKIAAAKKNLSDLSAEDDKQKLAEKRNAIIQLTSEMAGLGIDIAIGGIDREKNAITEQISLLEEKKNKEIEVANQSILNADERAKKIKEIEVRAAAEKERLERRQRQLDQERARWERAQAIANIVQNTAVAVTGYLAKGNYAMAILSGAIGAVQIARILTQPLPKYAKGKKKGDTYEGLAVVGDGGKEEVIERKDGRVEVTPKTDTLTWIGKDDIVHPSKDEYLTDLQMQLANKKVGQIVHNYQGKDKTADLGVAVLNSSINKGFSQLNRTIKNKQEVHIKGISRKDLLMRYGSNWEQYI